MPSLSPLSSLGTHQELQFRKPYVIRDEVMILISLTRKYYVSKLVYHEILIFSAPELSFLKNGPRRYEKTPLINFFIYATF